MRWVRIMKVATFLSTINSYQGSKIKSFNLFVQLDSKTGREMCKVDTVPL